MLGGIREIETDFKMVKDDRANRQSSKMANNVDLSLTSSVSITHDKMRGMMVCF